MLRSLRRISALATLLLSGACVSISGLGDIEVAPDPVAAEDAGSGSDAHLVDGSKVDAGGDLPVDGAAVDSKSDPDAADAEPPAQVVYQCVPPALDQGQGLLLDGNIWPGFRFEVSAGTDVSTTAVGLKAQGTGTVFAALVKLAGPTDNPDTANLSSPDVITKVLIGLGNSGISLAPVGVQLTPGWYAVFYGTGAHGATATSVTVPFQSGGGGCTNGSGPPISIRQSDGQFLLQGATPYFFVTGLRP